MTRCLGLRVVAGAATPWIACRRQTLGRAFPYRLAERLHCAVMASPPSRVPASWVPVTYSAPSWVPMTYSAVFEVPPPRLLYLAPRQELCQLLHVGSLQRLLAGARVS
jgi:hypothetical protein